MWFERISLMNKLSIVVPVYNTEKYLKQCLDSIVCQTYGDFQIVLVDNGSTDRSGEICDKYAESDARISVVHQENRGPAGARERGLQISDGRYVYFIDSDDWLDADLVENLINIIEQYHVDIVLAGSKREYENGRSFDMKIRGDDGIHDQKWIRDDMMPQIVGVNELYGNVSKIALWNYLIDRKLLETYMKNPASRVDLGDDIIVTYPCLLSAESIYVKQDIYYHYRQRGNSLKRNLSIENYKNPKTAYEVLLAKLCKDMQTEGLLQQIKDLFFYLYMSCTSGKIDTRNGIFPYQDFRKGSNIIIYGAGAFGRKIIDSLKESPYAHVAAWVDENRRNQDCVSPMKVLKDVEYDYIILGSLLADLRSSMRDTLKKYNVPEEKIIDIDKTKIQNASFLDMVKGHPYTDAKDLRKH